MNGSLQDMLPTILKIGAIPLILLSVLLRRRSDRQRRAAAVEAARDTGGRRTRSVFDLDEADIGAIQTGLERLADGEVLVTSRGQEITTHHLRGRLARRLLEAEEVTAAETIVEAMLDAAPDPAPDRAEPLLLLARIRAMQGREAKARACLSQAADHDLAALRLAARGSPVHLAELLAGGLPVGGPPDLLDPRLADYGPLPCLWLAGRQDEARALIAGLDPALDRALAGPSPEDGDRIEGLPRATVEAARDRLHSFLAV